jgi:hypothetical protein
MTPPREDDNATIRIVIPFKLRRRNGRPRIVPPADGSERPEAGTTNPKLMRAIARAWSWRRKLESGEAATLKDIADAERITVSFVSRFIRLAYLSPAVLERLLIRRSSSALSIEQLAAAACRPWAMQPDMVFDD